MWSWTTTIDWCRLGPEGCRRRPDEWCAEWVGSDDATRAVEREREQWARLGEAGDAADRVPGGVILTGATGAVI